MRGEPDDGVIAMAPGQFEEYRPVRFSRGRKLHRDQQLIRLEVGFEEACEEFIREDPAFPAFSGSNNRCVQGNSTRRVFRGRVRQREAAADRPAIANCRMRDMRDSLR